jgi:predicted heme/steroid binding protein/uncharacterized membrane protein
VKDYNPQQLMENDGQEGKPTLVAVNGKVYDLSQSKRWIAGSHMKRHKAGADLSEDIKAAPHGLDVLDRFEQVGTLVSPKEAPAEGFKGTVESLLDRHPFFRRHPHPAVVHFPVGLLTVAPLFEAIGLITRSPKTEWAAYCCVIVGLLSIPAAIVTGYFTWWINYDATDSPTLNKKRKLAWTALCLVLAAFLVRTFAVVDPLNVAEIWTVVYILLMVLLTAAVSAVGFLGGKLTFPYE